MRPSSRCTPGLTLLTVACVLSLAPCPRSSLAADSFVNFESEPVRPLALAPARDRLFAVNTPDNRLAIYDVTASGLVLAAEVPVGLEPIAVAARANGAGGVEAWVVNHLSDSVSVVEVDRESPTLSRVVRTLLVGDEPRDIVVAGGDHDRVFVTCARRGQNRFPGAEATGPEPTTPGVGRADVWVFDADDPGAPLGGTPLSIVQLFGDKPRALAASPDGARVYAAVFHSGNRTTTINESARAALAPLPPPPPGGLLDGPSTGLIVKFDSAAGRWEDELGRDWNAGVRFTLPDQDVFVIDANANPPALAPGANAVAGVGTTLFNMAVHPTNGKVYVSNLEARNDVRFVGPEGVTGHIVENRVTIIGGSVASPVHLNQHIDYGVAPGSEEEIGRSLALPLDLTFSADGATLFVAAFGSARVGAFATADLEAGVVTGTPLAVGRGPGGVVFDQDRDRLYVLNALDRTISIVSDASSPGRAVTGSVPLPFDPSPPEVTDGRGFLYDAHLSAHGDAACASCHLFGDVDGLAWDLGDPFGAVEPNPNPSRGPLVHTTFHPMKGPMMTQSLRGLADAGPMHWRGDRTGGNDPGGDPLDEEQAFKKFNVAFVSLQGAASELSDADIQRFTDFALTLRYPPNPVARLDGSLTPGQAAGASLFSTGGANDGQPCTFCHVSAIGTDGFSSDDGEPQTFKIPHFRNQYQKVGMFGVPPNTVLIPPTGPFGDQITGFGFLHDGATATIFDGLKMLVGLTDAERAELADFLMVFDPGLKPAVGQQVTVAAPGVADATVAERIALLLDRADASDCDLVVKGNRDGEARAWMYDVASGQFTSDRVSEGLVTEAALRAEAEIAGAERTYSCVPPDSGLRIGLDRDGDGFFDRTELDAGTDPADPNSRPALPGSTVRVRSGKLKLRGTTTDPAVRRIQFRSSTRRDPRANRIVPPAPGTSSDPTIVGATLRVYNSSGTGQLVAASLPTAGWTAVGAGADVRYRFHEAAGPIRKVVLRQDHLTIRGGGSSWSYVLDASAQGTVAVLFTAGADLHWCAEGGRSPDDPIVDTVGRFVASRNSPPPALCPALP